MARQYFGQRQGAPGARLALRETCRLVAAAYGHLEARGYFQQVFGYDCVDAPGGHADGSAGADLEAYVRLRTDQRNAIPIAKRLGKTDEVGLFTLVEFLYDSVSKPTDGFHHTFSNCGWHYRAFDKVAGRAEWRAEVGSVLARYGEGFELTEGGEVQRMGPPGLRDMLTASVPATSGVRDREKIAAAVHRFRLGRSTPKERADAVRDLADVLEFHRQHVQVHMLKKDESDLFNIANNFAIRHHNERQRTDYGEAWLNWMFYLYLSTIQLVLRLVEEQRGAGADPSTSVDAKKSR